MLPANDEPRRRGRGGPRPNQTGRPRVRLTIRLKPSYMRRLENYAKVAGKSVEETGENLIMAMLEQRDSPIPSQEKIQQN